MSSSAFREFHAPSIGSSASVVDTTYDFRSEVPLRSDPDRESITLRRYHQLLWSKPTPGGTMLRLADEHDGPFLHPGYRSSSTGTMVDLWSSDSIVNSWVHWTRASMADIVREVPRTFIDDYYARTCTIGGYMMWPCNRIGGAPTINQARGTNTAQIADRIDLTLECVRLYYAGLPSPLNRHDGDTLSRYRDYFELFVDFRGFVDFWLLQDLVSSDYQQVRFLLPFDGFSQPAVPGDVDEWMRFTGASMIFCSARNARIHHWAVEYLTPTSTPPALPS